MSRNKLPLNKYTGIPRLKNKMSHGNNVPWKLRTKVFQANDILLGLKKRRDKIVKGHFILRTMDSRSFVQGRLVLGCVMAPSSLQCPPKKSAIIKFVGFLFVGGVQS